jgi:DNA-directed RNA polymerase specialized sigma24 family protein
VVLANTRQPPSSHAPAGSHAQADGQLVAELYGRLRRFAAVVAPREMEPDDLLQEALARALRLRPLHSFEDPGAYLRRTMLNLAANARRRSGRHQRALARLARSGEPTVASYPSDLVLLGSLPPEVRAVLYLAEVEGWTYSEIARLVGCTEAAARARACRARRALRTVVENGDG